MMLAYYFVPKCAASGLLPWFILRLGLGWGLGCGLWSCLTYIALRFNILSDNRSIVEISIILIISVCFFYIWKRGYPEIRKNPLVAAPPKLSVLNRLLVVMFIMSLLIGLCLQLIQAINNPYGNWDAWAFWNLRASFIFKHSTEWAIAFDTNATNSNLDYPLLIPCLVFRMWDFIGTDSVVVPIVVGVLFTISCILVLVGGIWLLNDMKVALIAGICLISAKMFMVCGADQYSDVPLAFYFLSAIVLTSISTVYSQSSRSYLFLAGIMLGMAAWTKNEGLLIALAVLFACFLCLVVFHRKLSVYQACFILMGFLPVLCVVADFKMNVAPYDNAYVASSHLSRISSQLFQFDRYLIIAKRFLLELFTFHRWGYVSLFLIFYSVLRGFRNEETLRPCTCFTLFTTAVILGGYFGIYVITGQELVVHLDTSLNRLIVHVFPVIIFVLFMNAKGLVNNEQNWGPHGP